MSPLRIAFVTDRYAPGAQGEVERHCRLFAGRLAPLHRVEILTTRAAAPAAGEDECREPCGVHVRRFPVDPAGNPGRLQQVSRRAFATGHAPEDEILWLKLQRPGCPGLLEYLAANRTAYDVFFFYSYRTPATFFGLPLVAERAILLPAARPEPPLYLGIFDGLFRKTRRLLCFTPEEEALLRRRFFDLDLDTEVIGVGLDTPPEPHPEPDWQALRERIGEAEAGFLLCPGGIEDAYGCGRLIDLFRTYVAESGRPDLKLLITGNPGAAVPEHDQILTAGPITRATALHAVANARLVFAPWTGTLLGMSALESWVFGRPVLANGNSAVLRGQCTRSNGGLWYTSYGEFREAMNLLTDRGTLDRKLGQQGRAFVARAYSWKEFDRRIARVLTGTSGAAPAAE